MGRGEFAESAPGRAQGLVDPLGDVGTDARDVVLQLEVDAFSTLVVGHQHGTVLQYTTGAMPRT